MILKYILRNLYEKKFRVILIVFSLMLFSALFFVANGASTTTRTISLEVKKKYVGNSDILIKSNSKSPSKYLNIFAANQLKNETDYICGTMECSAVYKYNSVQYENIIIRGLDFDEINLLGPVRFVSQNNLEPFAGNKIIIGDNFARKYNLSVGDSIVLTVNKRQVRFIISAFADSIGSFIDDGEGFFVIAPRSYIGDIMGVHNGVNNIYVKAKEISQKEDLIKKFSAVFNRYSVNSSILPEEVEKDAKERTDPYKMIVVVVLFMSIFVVFSSFTVITMERLPVIGTMRSVGATKLMTNMILLGESIVYGILGGILGCLMGVLLLYIMLQVSIPDNLKSLNVGIDFTISQLLITFVLSVFVSLISSIIPIIKAARIPIKNVVLNTFENYKKNNSWKMVLGLVFLAITFFAPRFVVNSDMAIYVDLISMILPVAAVILLIPFITKAISKCISFLSVVFGNTWALSIKNIRENKNILNNTAILAISISCYMVINTLSFSVAEEVSDLFRNNANFDIMMYVDRSMKDAEALVYENKDVKSVYRTDLVSGIEIIDRDIEFDIIHGADTEDFLKYWDIKMLGNDKIEDALKKLNEGRSIIITSLMRDRLKVKAGDMIKIKTSSSSQSYKVAGFINSYNANGRYAIISSRYLRFDFNKSYDSEICIKTNTTDTTEAVKSLRKQFGSKASDIRSMSEQEKLKYEQYSSLFTMLKGFAVLTLIISLFGIVNNLIISFLHRKRYFAVMRSVGMNKIQLFVMLLQEAFVSGLIGGIVGSITGILMIYVMPYFMIAIEQVTPVHYSTDVILYCLLSGVIVTLAATITPLLKSSKLNIIAEIKYE